MPDYTEGWEGRIPPLAGLGDPAWGGETPAKVQGYPPPLVGQCPVLAGSWPGGAVFLLWGDTRGWEYVLGSQSGMDHFQLHLVALGSGQQACSCTPQLLVWATVDF